MRPLLIAVLVAVAPALARAQSVDPAVFADLHWRSIGPPRSGYVAAPAGIPGDAATYYIGLPEGGVWKTVNGGNTWTPVFDAVHVASVGAVAVAPSNHDVVYVGTGDRSGWSFTAGKGVYKSTDAGRTWTNVGLPHSQYIGGLVVDPRNADVVLVAAFGPRSRGRGQAPPAPAPDAQEGLYRTADGGRTWTRVLPSANAAAPAIDVYMDYADPQMVYALLDAGRDDEASGTGAFRSSDGGVTWQAIGIEGLPEDARISALTVASGTHGRRLYAVASVGAGRGRNRALYVSDDGGRTWTAGARQLASAGGKIYADPQNPDTVYLMGTAIYRSTDGGRHVAAFWGAPSGADPRFLWIDPTNSKRLIAGVDQGVAISMDAGRSWTPYYGLVNGQFYRVSTDFDFPYHVCGPQQDSGTACVRSRSDYGEIRPNDWYSPGGFENGFLIADPLDSRYMYTQGWYHVLRRFDRRTNQVVVLYQPTPDDRFDGAPPLAFAPGDHRTLYMGAQHVLASDDRGLTWRRISGDLAAIPGAPVPADAPTGVGAPAPGGSITALAPSPVSGEVVWVGASTGLIHVTRDAGKSWTDVTPPDLPAGSINVIDPSHADAGTAYVALLSRDEYPHIYRTTDYGRTWREISSGLADGAVVRVVREDPAVPDIVYAGTVTGVWVSFDRGDRWQSLQLDLPTTVVSDLTVHDSDVIVSTYGRGFYILDDVTPLRQARAALAARAPAFFFKPAPAWRARWDNTQDTPMPPEMVVGENPPEGAILDYYLAAPATGRVTLTISDPSGGVIRTYSSVASPPDTTMANVPEYWLAPPMVLPTTAGMHRVAWDLRYADPPALNYGYRGTPLDYREYTLSWHAIPGHTPRSTLVGPMVLPGTYTATLEVNGQRLTQPVTVVADPRITVPAEGLAAQFRLQQRAVAGVTATYDAVTYINQVREALAARVKAAQGKDRAIAAAARPIGNALDDLERGADGFGAAHRDLGRRLNDLLVADFAPTASVTEGVDRPCASIDGAIGRLRTLQGADIKKMDAALARAGLEPLPAWTPPAAPACGSGS